MVIRKLHGCYKSVRDEAKTSVQPTKKPISSPSKVWVFLFLQGFLLLCKRFEQFKPFKPFKPLKPFELLELLNPPQRVFI